MIRAKRSEMRVDASKYSTIVGRKSGKSLGGGRTAHDREAGMPMSRPCFQSRRCFVSSSSYQPRALPPSRLICRFTPMSSAKKARIWDSKRARSPESSPWLTTWKKPHPSHALAISRTSAAGGSPSKAGRRSITGTSPSDEALEEKVRAMQRETSEAPREAIGKGGGARASSEAYNRSEAALPTRGGSESGET
eukprot:scaffold264154_cov31-Tisochrysis_lutea.AAC.1